MAWHACMHACINQSVIKILNLSIYILLLYSILKYFVVVFTRTKSNSRRQKLTLKLWRYAVQIIFFKSGIWSGSVLYVKKEIMFHFLSFTYIVNSIIKQLLSILKQFPLNLFFADCRCVYGIQSNSAVHCILAWCTEE